MALPVAVAHAGNDATGFGAGWGPKWGVDEGATAERGVMVAEFRADELPTDPAVVSGRERFNAALGARFRASGDPSIAAGTLDPLGLRGYSPGDPGYGATRTRAPGLAAVLDYRMRNRLRLDIPYTDAAAESALRVGPEMAITPGLRTRVYYRHGPDVADLLRPNADFRLDDVSGAGLSQTWWFSDIGNIELGYEFEQQNVTDMPLSMEGHRVNVAGQIPLRWGVSAQFEAAYSWNSYPEYFGSADLESDRRALSAGVSGSIGEQLSGSLMFHYADETFDDEFLSYRRSAWGLNLHYTY